MTPMTIDHGDVQEEGDDEDLGRGDVVEAGHPSVPLEVFLQPACASNLLEKQTKVNTFVKFPLHKKIGKLKSDKRWQILCRVGHLGWGWARSSYIC